MNIQLISTPNPQFNTVQQILFNRGMLPEEVKHYLNLNETDINSFELLGKGNLIKGAELLTDAIKNHKKTIVIVDSDCDGYTSAALLINYLYYLFPQWVETCVDFRMHSGKQHGLADHIEWIEQEKIPLVICPDSSSNDYEYHERIRNYGGNVLVLDHHLADEISKNAIIINNQLSEYPNKDLAGVGVTWQFCRYLDSLMGTDKSNLLVDLVALGLCGDMMSLKSYETRFLITLGFNKNNIHNPFIEYMLDKNSFPLSKTDYQSAFATQACTNIGAAFFIVPFVNAVTRSGTMKEKELIFNSMLNHKAFEKIDEIKRNKKTGKQEFLVLQAVRTIGNIKNRQTREEKEGLRILEKIIKEKDLLSKHQILLLLLEEGQIPNEIRGLVANKLMAKYQRPCAILTKTKNNTYEGSMRGYTKTGISSFKNVLTSCPGVLYVRGHDNAAGLGIEADKIDMFLAVIDMLLAGTPTEPVYRVDYFFRTPLSEFDKAVIYDIADLNDFWGQDIDRALVAIKFSVTNKNFQIMKNNTLKIVLDNGLSLIKFGGTDEDIDNFTTSGWKEVNAVCKCAINEWNGESTPQLLIENYEIINQCNYLF